MMTVKLTVIYHETKKHIITPLSLCPLIAIGQKTGTISTVFAKPPYEELWHFLSHYIPVYSISLKKKKKNTQKLVESH